MVHERDDFRVDSMKCSYKNRPIEKPASLVHELRLNFQSAEICELFLSLVQIIAI